MAPQPVAEPQVTVDELIRRARADSPQLPITRENLEAAQQRLNALCARCRPKYLQALVGTRTQQAALESVLGATPPADVLGAIVNPTGATTPPGVAVPGTIAPDVIPPNTVAPLHTADAPANPVLTLGN